MNTLNIEEVYFTYGSKSTSFAVTTSKVFDLTNNKEFDLISINNGSLNFSNKQIHESGKVISIKLKESNEEKYELIKAMLGAKKLNAKLVKIEDKKDFYERKMLSKNNLGKIFSICGSDYAYKY